MSKRRFKFRRVKLKTNGTEVNINLKRFERQFSNAQYWMDNQVMTDMVPYMPRQSGTFINLVRARSAALAGSGIVVAAVPPQGRFLWEGKVMVDPDTGSPFARKGAKKIVTDRPLTYGNPRATPKWFYEAKHNHGKSWEVGVKKRAGGG